MPTKSIKNTRPMKSAKEQTSVASTITAVTLSTMELHNLISKRAYEIFLQRGTGWGNEVEDWLLAEQEITVALQATTQACIQTAIAEPTLAKPKPRRSATSPPSVKAQAKRSVPTTRTRKKPTPEI